MKTILITPLIIALAAALPLTTREAPGDPVYCDSLRLQKDESATSGRLEAVCVPAGSTKRITTSVNLNQCVSYDENFKLVFKWKYALYFLFQLFYLGSYSLTLVVDLLVRSKELPLIHSIVLKVTFSRGVHVMMLALTGYYDVYVSQSTMSQRSKVKSIFVSLLTTPIEGLSCQLEYLANTRVDRNSESASGVFFEDNRLKCAANA